MKVYASIPTMPSRLNVLETAVKSISKQVDLTLVFLNGFTEEPAWLKKMDRVLPLMPPENRGSVSRFFINDMGIIKKDDLVFYCDDDLVYPPDYASIMVSKWIQHGTLITAHGRKLKKGQPIRNWSRDFWDKVYPCLEKQERDDRVDICGTGVLLIPYGILPITTDLFKHDNYDDVEFSILAYEQRVPITCISHESDWIQYLNPSGPTIWSQTSKVGHKPLLDLVNASNIWKNP